MSNLDKEEIKNIISYQTSCDLEDLKPETRLIEDLCMDTLDIVDLVMSIEKKFDIVVADESIDKILTLNDLYEEVSRISGK